MGGGQWTEEAISAFFKTMPLGPKPRLFYLSTPKIGASWEGFILEQITRHLDATTTECHFWATHQGAELDLLVVRGRRRRGFEIKRTTTPSVTKSMHVAMADLKLETLDVVHAGRDTFPLAPGIRAVAAVRLLEDVEKVGAA